MSRTVTFSALVVAGATALLATACGTSKSGNASNGVAGCQPNASISCACPGGTTGSQMCAADGQSYSLCQCGAAGYGAAGTGVGGAGLTGGFSGNGSSLGGTANTGSPLPCSVSSILQTHCSLCHSAVPSYGAPMPLVTWEDLQAPSKTDPTVPVYQKMLQRIQDPQKPMPQPPNPLLAATDIATLQAWVSGGTLKGTDPSCMGGSAGTSGGAGGGGSAGTNGSAGTSGAADGGMPTDVTCYRFLANDSGGSTGPKFNVPSTPDSYVEFNFAPPWGNAQVLGVTAHSLIDNKQAVHHWILYSSSTALQDGTNSPGVGAHPGGQFVVGWAPGAPDMKLPDDVGLQLPGAGYQLEIHYNAPSAGMTDQSGVELCVTTAPRAHTAATHPLGQEAFATAGAGDVVGTCVPRGPFPITILTSSPHMHKTGTHMKTVIHRANGTTETLVDQPFDFGTQLSYQTPATINQGDSLETTCTYNAAAQFGTKTTQEMCYDFVVAYPAGALAGAAGYTGVSGNGNTCINASLGGFGG
ncbi:MAG TPA: hypothetical protein VF331_27580 [Polyangiales bacterium]